MFVKIYRYKVRRKDFRKWKKNNDASTKLNKKYGGEFMRLVRKDGRFFNVIELGFYKSKKDFARIMKGFDSDPRTNALYEEFLGIVHNKRFTEEEFETV